MQRTQARTRRNMPPPGGSKLRRQQRLHKTTSAKMMPGLRRRWSMPESTDTGASRAMMGPCSGPPARRDARDGDSGADLRPREPGPASLPATASLREEPGARPHRRGHRGGRGGDGRALPDLRGGGTYLLSRAGAREPKPFELDNLIAAVRYQLADRFLAEVSTVNCRTPGRAPGLRTVLGADKFSPEELARALTAAADGAAPGATIYLEVNLLPPPGPRCAPDDPACEPLPYEGSCAEQTGYDPRATRKPAGMLGHAGGACSYDGECVIGGCGNDCGPPSIKGPKEPAALRVQNAHLLWLRESALRLVPDRLGCRCAASEDGAPARLQCRCLQRPRVSATSAHLRACSACNHDPDFRPRSERSFSPSRDPRRQRTGRH